jgi:hypothetical protein
MRTPATPEGERRRAKSANALESLSAWLEGLMDAEARATFAPIDDTLGVDFIAAALLCVWSRLLSPLVPPWVVAPAVMEQVSATLRLQRMETVEQWGEQRVALKDARAVLFDVIDAFAESRHPAELEAVGEACRSATCGSPSGQVLTEERQWLQAAGRGDLWEGVGERSSTLSRAEWAWALPYTDLSRNDADQVAVAELPCVWVEMPALLRDALEAKAASSGGLGSASVTVELVVAPALNSRTSREEEEEEADSDATGATTRSLATDGYQTSSAGQGSAATPEHDDVVTQSNVSSAAEVPRERNETRACHARRRRTAALDGHVLFLEEEASFGARQVLRGGVTFALRRQGTDGIDTHFQEDHGALQGDGTAMEGEEGQVNQAATALHVLDRLEASVATHLAVSINSNAAVRESTTQPTSGNAVLAVAPSNASDEERDLIAIDDSASEDEPRPWQRRVRLQRTAPETYDTVRDLPDKCTQLSDTATSSSSVHLVSGILFGDHRDSGAPLPGTQPLDSRTRRQIARCAVSDAAAANPDGVMIRYVDGHGDAVLACSLAALIQVFADERPVAKGMVVYAAPSDADVPQLLAAEVFDRGADEASSSEDEEPNLPLQVPRKKPVPRSLAQDRRTLTYDIFLHPCASVLDQTLRRHAARTGGLQLVRRLCYLLRDCASRSPAGSSLGVFSGCIGGQGSHITIHIAPSNQAVSTHAATPEALGMLPRPRGPSIDRAGNSQALLQAHIRSMTPEGMTSKSVMSVPLGGWRARPAGGCVPGVGRLRRTVGVDIPPSAVKSTALPSSVIAVAKTSYGFQTIRSAPRSTSPSSPHSDAQLPRFDLTDVASVTSASYNPSPHSVKAAAHTGITPYVLDGPTATLAATNPRAQVPTQQPKRQQQPPREPRRAPFYVTNEQPAADTLGEHPRHPGATAEWVYLDATKRRAVSSADHAGKALERLARYTHKLPSAPSGHNLSVGAVKRCLDDVRMTSSGAKNPAAAADPDLEGELQAPLESSKLAFKARP